EINQLEASDIIIFYFKLSTISPISLLELGLYTDSKKLVVYYPKGFYRRGNI
ncbi:uncharacterized protein BDZ99DRAFT_388495, partial [Mytilinidion resinicola]